MAIAPGSLLVLAILAVAAAAPARAEQVVWRFDNTASIGGFLAEAEGAPRRVDSPLGAALQFDGKGDSVLIRGRPLVGAATFTIEAVVRPEGGVFAQRFMHIGETPAAPPSPGTTADTTSRFMFEVRVVGDAWYLDSFMRSSAGTKFFALPEKTHPLGRWYAVAQTYDGKTYRTYVDGVLEGEGDVGFAPHGPGEVRVGARLNRVDYFKGSIALARFTDRALAPAELLVVPAAAGR